MGSSPAEGSSNIKIPGSSAMARARPARFCMPPLISNGYVANGRSSPEKSRSRTRESALGQVSTHTTRGRAPSTSTLMLSCSTPWCAEYVSWHTPRECRSPPSHGRAYAAAAKENSSRGSGLAHRRTHGEPIAMRI